MDTMHKQTSIEGQLLGLLCGAYDWKETIEFLTINLLHLSVLNI